MRARFREHPPWLVRIDRGTDSVGAGVLISSDLVLTCAHVVAAALAANEKSPEPPAGDVSLTLVNLPGPVSSTGRVEPDGWIPVDEDGRGDIAVLRLNAPIKGAEPAWLRTPAAVADHAYVVQGFPGRRRHVAEARGRLSGRAGPGWVQLDDERTTGHLIDRGFSGSPVWDDTLHAVVGIVVAREPDRSLRVGHMLPIAEVTRHWPRIEEFTGWRLDPHDPHWLPRARGVEPHEATDVWYFAGRHRALGELAGWLDPGLTPDGRARVVIGSPGSGKSAVVARLVVLADRTQRDRVPAENLPAGVPLPASGCVTVAVHARGRTLPEVIAEIADATEVEAADSAQLIQGLQHRGRPVTIVLDALDEAAGDAAVGIATLLCRIAADPGRLGFRVLVGTRVGARGAAANILLSRLGNPVIIDLDDEYLEHGDLVIYATRRLTAGGDQAAMLPELAHAIAKRANGNFLIAQLACLTALSASSDGATAADWAARLPTTVAGAIDEYLDIRFGERAQVVRDLLLPLAVAEAPGLTEGPLWTCLANALAVAEYQPSDLRKVLASAASYLVQDVGADPPAYRLFHQALDDTFRRQYEERNPGRDPDRIVYEALLSQVPADADCRTRWDQAPDYVRENLAAHAVAAGRLDSLLGDVGYLVVVDPERIAPHLGHASTERARAAAHVYRRAMDELGDREYADRAAHLALVARQKGFARLADDLAARFQPLPWSADLVAWEVEGAQQVLLRLPATVDDVALWLDAHGNPAALASLDRKAVLHRFVDYRLAEDDTVDLTERSSIFRAHAPLVLANGREVALTVDGDGALMKWAFGNGLQLLGSVLLRERSMSRWDIDMISLPDGRLLAVVAHPDAVLLVDATRDLPEVLYRKQSDAPGEIFSNSATAAIGMRDGVVYVGIFDRTTVKLCRVVDHKLIDLGEPLRDHRVNAAVLRFVTRPDGGLLLVSASMDLLVVSEVTSDGLSTVSTTEAASITSIGGASLPDGQSIAAYGDLFGQVWMLTVDENVSPIAEPVRSHEWGVDTITVGPGPFGGPIVLSVGGDHVVRMSDFNYLPPAVTDVPSPYRNGVTSVELLTLGEEVAAAVTGGVGQPLELLLVADQLRAFGEPVRVSGDAWFDMSATIGLGMNGGLVVAALGAGRLDVWAGSGDGGWALLGSGQVSAKSEIDTPLAVTVDESGSPLVAVGGMEGKVLCYQLADGAWHRYTGYEPPGAETRSYLSDINQLRFYSAANGSLRLLVASGERTESFAVPAEGPLVPLATMAGVTRFSITYVGRTPLAGMYRRNPQVKELQLVVLNDDAFEPVTPSWPCRLDFWPSVAVASTPDGRIRCAAAGNDGVLEVWSAIPRGAPRSLARIQANSSIQAVAWTDSGSLVAWCQSGVLKVRGTGW